MRPHYHQLRSRSYRILRAKLRLAELFGYRQRSDIAGNYSYIRTRREYVYFVYVGRAYGS